LSDQAHLPRIRLHGCGRRRPPHIVMARVEFANQLIQLERCFPDIEQKQAAVAATLDPALAIDSRVVPFMFGATAVEFARADLQG